MLLFLASSQSEQTQFVFIYNVFFLYIELGNSLDKR